MGIPQIRGRRHPARRHIAAVLRRIEQRLQVVEARGTPEQWRQAFQDLLAIFNATSQTASVVRIQAEQIQALADAYTRLSVAVKGHDEISTTERAAIMELMSGMDLLMGSLIEVVRDQVQMSHDIARAVEADLTPRERKRAKEKPPANS